MKKILSLLFAVCISATMFAADIIVTTQSQRISAKIEEVGLDVVKYRRSDNLTGPIYSIAKSDIQSITYENGYVETFNLYTPAKPSVVVQQTSSNANNTNNNANIPREMLRNQCETEFQKGKTLMTVGIGFSIVGVVALPVGIYCIVDNGGDLGTLIAGDILTAVGAVSIPVGIPLWAVGLHKQKHAYDAYKNMYGANLEFNLTAGQNGIGIAMKF